MFLLWISRKKTIFPLSGGQKSLTSRFTFRVIHISLYIYRSFTNPRDSFCQELSVGANFVKNGCLYENIFLHFLKNRMNSCLVHNFCNFCHYRWMSQFSKIAILKLWAGRKTEKTLLAMQQTPHLFHDTSDEVIFQMRTIDFVTFFGSLLTPPQNMGDQGYCVWKNAIKLPLLLKNNRRKTIALKNNRRACHCLPINYFLFPAHYFLTKIVFAKVLFCVGHIFLDTDVRETIQKPLRSIKYQGCCEMNYNSTQLTALPENFNSFQFFPDFTSTQLICHLKIP